MNIKDFSRVVVNGQEMSSVYMNGVEVWSGGWDEPFAKPSRPIIQEPVSFIEGSYVEITLPNMDLKTAINAISAADADTVQHTIKVYGEATYTIGGVAETVNKETDYTKTRAYDLGGKNIKLDLTECNLNYKTTYTTTIFYNGKLTIVGAINIVSQFTFQSGLPQRSYHYNFSCFSQIELYNSVFTLNIRPSLATSEIDITNEASNPEGYYTNYIYAHATPMSSNNCIITINCYDADLAGIGPPVEVESGIYKDNMVYSYSISSVSTDIVSNLELKINSYQTKGLNPIVPSKAEFPTLGNLKRLVINGLVPAEIDADSRTVQLAVETPPQISAPIVINTSLLKPLSAEGTSINLPLYLEVPKETDVNNSFVFNCIGEETTNELFPVKMKNIVRV